MIKSMKMHNFWMENSSVLHIRTKYNEMYTARKQRRKICNVKVMNNANFLSLEEKKRTG